jgi:thiol-disulfide isomerase/thioredoxin
MPAYSIEMARKIATFIRKNTTLIVVMFLAIIFFNQYYAYASSAAAVREGMSGRQASGGAELLYFSMDGCGHCKRFNPAWDEFVKQNKYPGLRKVKVMSDTEDPSEKSKLSKHKVKGFPTIVLVVGDQGIPFDGERTVAGLDKFCKEHLK